MDALPNDVLHRVYVFCTPTRRKQLLQVSSAVATSLRPAMTQCLVVLDPTKPFALCTLPQAQKYPHLGEVFLDCNCAQLQSLCSRNTLVSFGAPSGVRLCFRNAAMYYALQPYAILGIKSAYFRPETSKECAEVAYLVEKCQELQNISIFANPAEYLGAVKMASSSMVECSTVNFNISGLSMPNLRRLCCHNTTMKLLTVSPLQLTRLSLSVASIDERLELPRALQYLSLQLVRRSTISAHLPRLSSLSLVNVCWAGRIDITVPVLAQLELFNSVLPDTPGPVQTLHAAVTHSKLRYFHVISYAPTDQELQVWEAIRATSGSDGYCDKAAINLTIHMKKQT